MTKLNPKAVKDKLEQGSICFVDVRSQDEFQSGHAAGAVCLPLETIEGGAAPVPRDRLVVLSCQSGMRSARAREILKAQGYENVAELEGGFAAWSAAGFPVNRSRRAIPVIRQVMITAGFLVFLGSMLGIVVSPAFLALPVFVGAGLMFAGITGFCGMAMILEKMPWNRVG
jgi:rhodanese-related sulfurtransferase